MTPVMTERITRFLADHSPETPCLVVDLHAIAEAYEALLWYLPLARIYYAVKANPAAEIVATLERKGASFDVASRGEVELCLANGVAPDRLQRSRARQTGTRGARRSCLLPYPRCLRGCGVAAFSEIRLRPRNGN